MEWSEGNLHRQVSDLGPGKRTVSSRNVFLACVSLLRIWIYATRVDRSGLEQTCIQKRGSISHEAVEANRKREKVINQRENNLEAERAKLVEELELLEEEAGVVSFEVVSFFSS